METAGFCLDCAFGEVTIPSNGSSLFQLEKLAEIKALKALMSQSPQTGQVYFNKSDQETLLKAINILSQSPQTGQVYFNLSLL